MILKNKKEIKNIFWKKKKEIFKMGFGILDCGEKREIIMLRNTFIFYKN